MYQCPVHVYVLVKLKGILTSNAPQTDVILRSHLYGRCGMFMVANVDCIYFSNSLNAHLAKKVLLTLVYLPSPLVLSNLYIVFKWNPHMCQSTSHHQVRIASTAILGNNISISFYKNTDFFRRDTTQYSWFLQKIDSNILSYILKISLHISIISLCILEIMLPVT